MTLWLVFAYVLAVAGHAALWIALVNYLHGLAMPRPLIRLLTIAAYGWMGAAPLMAILFALQSWPATPSGTDRLALPAWLRVYGALCSLLAVGPLQVWVWRRLTLRPPAVLLSNHTTTLDLRDTVARSAARGPGAWLARRRGNEALALDVNEKTMDVPRLPPALDGLSIVHLSDLHYSGRIGQEFFHEVVRLANELQPDLVAVTGDLIDRARCIAWIAPTLGRLVARYGAYYVLGNHDLRVDTEALRAELAAAGLIDLGGAWRMLQINGQAIALAGNELPWIKRAADIEQCPLGAGGQEPFRILLAHTPDQYAWARRCGFDLMLAGHTHGGQIQLPLLGPIVAPSLHGVRYASGTFYEPPTVLHVSRGVSSLLPLRINCRPELTKLVLRAGKGSGVDVGEPHSPG